MYWKKHKFISYTFGWVCGCGGLLWRVLILITVLQSNYIAGGRYFCNWMFRSLLWVMCSNSLRFNVPWKSRVKLDRQTNTFCFRFLNTAAMSPNNVFFNNDTLAMCAPLAALCAVYVSSTRTRKGTVKRQKWQLFVFLWHNDSENARSSMINIGECINIYIYICFVINRVIANAFNLPFHEGLQTMKFKPKLHKTQRQLPQSLLRLPSPTLISYDIYSLHLCSLRFPKDIANWLDIAWKVSFIFNLYQLYFVSLLTHPTPSPFLLYPP